MRALLTLVGGWCWLRVARHSRQLLSQRTVVRRVFLSPFCSQTYHTPARKGWMLFPLYAFGLFGWFPKDENPKVPAFVETCFRKAKQAVIDGEYKEAEFQYHQALELLAVSPYSASKPFLNARRIANKRLASLYLKMEHHKEALLNYSESMKMMLAYGESTLSRGMVETSLKVAEIYTDMEKYSMARAGLEWCLETAENKVRESPVPENLELLGMCQHAMGQFYFAKGSCEQAQLWFSHSLDTARQAYGRDNMQTAVLCSDIAAALEGLMQYDKAEELVSTAISISSQCSNVSPEHMARLFMNLGAIRNNQGKKMDATAAYTTAMEHASLLPDDILLTEIETRLQDMRRRQ